MKVTSFEATVENGVIKLPEHVQLPEKTRVYVVIPGVDA
jgi:predicted DNA-binding antitoxin AbrB/MazE fold protein